MGARAAGHGATSYSRNVISSNIVVLPKCNFSESLFLEKKNIAESHLTESSHGRIVEPFFRGPIFREPIFRELVFRGPFFGDHFFGVFSGIMCTQLFKENVLCSSVKFQLETIRYVYTKVAELFNRYLNGNLSASIGQYCLKDVLTLTYRYLLNSSATWVFRTGILECWNRAVCVVGVF